MKIEIVGHWNIRLWFSTYSGSNKYSANGLTDSICKNMLIWLLNELLIILKNELEPKERSINPTEKHFEKGKFSR